MTAAACKRHAFPGVLALLALLGTECVHAFQVLQLPHDRSRAACLGGRRRESEVALRMHVDPLVANIVIGGISGTVSNMAVYPLELVKTRMQNAVSVDDKAKYKDLGATIAHIAADKGVAGLWEGSTPVLLGSAPESSIQLAAHSFLVAQLVVAAGVNGEAGLTVSQQMLAGALAGGATLIATNPMEVLRLQGSEGGDGEGGGMLDNMRKLFAKEGPLALFDGAGATLLRDIPFAALYFALYCHFKVALTGHEQWVVELFSGLGAGACASFLTTPADVVKTRIQSRVGKPASPPSPPRLYAAFATEDDLTAGPTTTSAELAHIITSEGWSSLMSGAKLRVLKLAPRMAISLTIYETLQRLVN